MRNLNDGSDRAPRFRADIHLGTVWQLPAWSAGPRGDDPAFYETIAAAGYEGVQGGDPARCAALGLACTTFGVHREPGTLLDLVKLWRDLGFEASTLHVGTGIESDAVALAMLTEVLDAADVTGLPLYVETHRATCTQDPWRTVTFIDELPELRFNGDFSHWYTGGEMTYGDFDAKLAFLAPVFERTRYLHGRIGDPGCMQIALGPDVPDDHPSIGHFRRFWTAAAAGFLTGAEPGDVLPLAPELLPSSINYAQTHPSPGGPVEGSDRWTDALRLIDLARRCFDDATRTTSRSEEPA